MSEAKEDAKFITKVLGHAHEPGPLGTERHAFLFGHNLEHACTWVSGTNADHKPYLGTTSSTTQQATLRIPVASATSSPKPFSLHTTSQVQCAALSHDGTVLATVHTDGTIQLFRVPEHGTGEAQALASITAEQTGSSSITSCVLGPHFSQNTAAALGTRKMQAIVKMHGRYLQVAAKQADVADAAPCSTPQTSTPATGNSSSMHTAIQPPASGVYMATVDSSGQVKVWKICYGGQPTCTELPAGELQSCCCFSPDGNWLAYGYADGTVGIVPRSDWDQEGASGSSLETGYPVLCCAFDPTSSYLLTAGGKPQHSGQLGLWKVEDGGGVQLLCSVPRYHAQPITSCYFWLPEGSRSYRIVTSAGRETRVITELVGIQRDEEAGVQYPVSLLPPAAAEAEAAVQMAAEAATPPQRMLTYHTSDILLLLPSKTFSTSSTSCDATIRNGIIQLTRKDEGFTMHEIELRDSVRDDITCCEFLGADGRLLVAGHVSGLVTVWDTQQFQLLQLHRALNEAVRHVGFFTHAAMPDQDQQDQSSGRPVQGVWYKGSSDGVQWVLVDPTLMACFRQAFKSHAELACGGTRSSQALLQALQWHMTQGLLQEQGLLQLVLEVAAEKGSTLVLRGVLQLFASKGWKPALGPLLRCPTKPQSAPPVTNICATSLPTQSSMQGSKQQSSMQGSRKNLMSLAVDSWKTKQGSYDCIVALADALLAGSFSNYSTWLHLEGALLALATIDYHQQLFFDLVMGMQLLDMGNVCAPQQLVEGGLEQRARSSHQAKPKEVWGDGGSGGVAAEAKLLPLRSSGQVGSKSLLVHLREKDAPAEVYGGEIPRALIAYKSEQLKIKQRVWGYYFLGFLSYAAAFFVFQLLTTRKFDVGWTDTIEVVATCLGALLVAASLIDCWGRRRVLPQLAKEEWEWLPKAAVRARAGLAWIRELVGIAIMDFITQIRVGAGRQVLVEDTAADAALVIKPPQAENGSVAAQGNTATQQQQPIRSPTISLASLKASTPIGLHHRFALANDALMLLVFLLYILDAPDGVFRVFLVVNMLLLALYSSFITKGTSQLGAIWTMLGKLVIELRWFMAAAVMIILGGGIIMTTLITPGIQPAVPGGPSAGADSAPAAAEDSDNHFHSYWLSWLQMYSFVGPDYDLYKQVATHQDRLEAVVGFAFLVFYHILINIVMLNMLIAIVNEIFTRVKPQQELYKLRHRAAQLIDTEAKQLEVGSGIEGDQLPYLHVLEPQQQRPSVLRGDSSSAGSGAAGEFEALSGEMKGLKAAQNSLQMQVQAQSVILEGLQAQMKEVAELLKGCAGGGGSRSRRLSG